MKITLPDIPESERTPLVVALLAVIEQLVQENARQSELIQQLRNEIAILKGEKPRPTFKTSGMAEQAGAPPPAGQDEGDDEDGDSSGGEGEASSPSGSAKEKRPGSEKRRKKPQLPIHETVKLAPVAAIPPGSVFKGYDDFIVQDIRFEVHNICYRRAIWQTPEGEWLRGQLPDYQQGNDFGPILRQFIIYQHHHCQVTQPLIHEQLREIGVDISAGQIDALLTRHSDDFIDEANAVLRTGLQYSDYINVDDSGARHQGKNGYVTHIGNEAFAWFSTTFSKSRINFLELLHGGSPRYACNNTYARDYWVKQGLSKQPLATLYGQPSVADPLEWEALLDSLGIVSERHRRIATEGALLGGLIENGFNTELVIMSDGAGQFAILLHTLCWVHAERLVHKLIPLNEAHREAIAQVRDDIWSLYADLKDFSDSAAEEQVEELTARFDAIFTQNTAYQTLNALLKRLHKRKDELLLILKYPHIPLHNNLSEGDIREYVKKRKISGGTRSDTGRRCRDAFASLKKTCRKHGLSFWNYLGDRIRNVGEIPPLAEMVRERLLPA